jgi:Domain of unknown function (DUF6438)
VPEVWLRARIIQRALCSLCLVLDAPESEQVSMRATGWMVRRSCLLLAIFGRAASGEAQAVWLRGDSVLMTSSATGCAGPCPAYRVRIDHSGEVEFESRTRGDNGRRERASRGPTAWTAIAEEFSRIAFDSLPVIRVGEAPLCRAIMSDGTTVVITWFSRSAAHSREYYMSCMGEGPSSGNNAAAPYLTRFWALATQIDRTAGVAPWLGR